MIARRLALALLALAAGIAALLVALSLINGLLS
jgi:hypothetical protein